MELCFEHGSKISIDEMHHDIGGSACNVAVGLKRFGLNTAVISPLGGDEDADIIKSRLEVEGVDIKFLKTFSKNQTNNSVILVYGEDRTVFVYRGLKDYSLLKIPKNLKTKWLYLGPVANTFEPNYKKLISLASEKNVNMAINPGHRQIIEGREALTKLLYVSKVLILNKEEAIDLTKMPHMSSIKELLKRLKSFGPEIVIITDGSEGAYLTDGENFSGIKSLEVDVVDSTGAGDAFSSGFLAGYINRNDFMTSMKWGILNSTEVLKSYGAQTKLFTLEEIEQRLKFSPDVYKLQ
ncbi:hypothetical protein A3F08_00635 [Candidatus Berkelbacteria bacterium RIFCSPHIGHO2_12_FULL_36_9]|uniref:Carbohydrate kinase PfkB domain-containing protein n=1 Tax=Candidatus Berkelbacteria bacterium RIFCSPHIGHO2_12_FULL_36_9 TaxID=1797469 RepID=A0A1F5EF20_9BACT|nr:MAG: hypothetical protein A3F08_00635 [Candidatus Berkelbacteria bacterium RIFCSPHIGHO2_12_FULL_36_9]